MLTLWPVSRSNCQPCQVQVTSLDPRGATGRPLDAVVEISGNPIEISAVVVYRAEDTYKAALHVESYKQFIEGQVVQANSQNTDTGGVHCLLQLNNELAGNFMALFLEARLLFISGLVIPSLTFLTCCSWTSFIAGSAHSVL